VWSGGGRHRIGGVGTFETRGACKRAVGWWDSGQLEVRCDLFENGMVRVCRLLPRWHIGIDGQVVVGAG
jgi:hypothetical protein